MATTVNLQCSAFRFLKCKTKIADLVHKSFMSALVQEDMSYKRATVNVNKSNRGDPTF